MHDPEKESLQDCLGGPVGKNLPANAGDTGSIPGQGARIPHGTEPLRPHTTATEPMHHN